MKFDWLNAILKLGIPGAIAIFLVWRLATGFDMLDTRMVGMETQHIQVLTQMNSAESIMAQLLMNNERVLWVLQQTCVQNARGTNQVLADAQARCFGPR